MLVGALVLEHTEHQPTHVTGKIMAFLGNKNILVGL